MDGPVGSEMPLIRILIGQFRHHAGDRRRYDPLEVPDAWAPIMAFIFFFIS